MLLPEHLIFDWAQTQRSKLSEDSFYFLTICSLHFSLASFILLAESLAYSAASSLFSYSLPHFLPYLLLLQSNMLTFVLQNTWSKKMLNSGCFGPSFLIISGLRLSHNILVDIIFTSVSSGAQSCLILCDSTDCRIPGFPVHHQLLEPAQTHVHRVGDAIQPSLPLSSPSPPVFNLAEHQGLFQWVSSSNQGATVLEVQLQHQSFQWIFRTDFL